MLSLREVSTTSSEHSHMGRSAVADLLCASAQARRSASRARSSSALRRLDPERACLNSTRSTQPVHRSPIHDRPRRLLPCYPPDLDACRHATHPTQLLAVTLPTRPQCPPLCYSPDPDARRHATRATPVRLPLVIRDPGRQSRYGIVLRPPVTSRCHSRKAVFQSPPIATGSTT